MSGGIVDCDVHCAPTAAVELHPYLEEYWQEYISGSGIRITGLPVAYPPSAPTTAITSARGDGSPAIPSTYDQLKERVLDPVDPRFAILNCLTGFEAHRHPYYAAALASALNDWLRAEWLERDPRLRASIVVPGSTPTARSPRSNALATTRGSSRCCFRSGTTRPTGTSSTTGCSPPRPSAT